MRQESELKITIFGIVLLFGLPFEYRTSRNFRKGKFYHDNVKVCCFLFHLLLFSLFDEILMDIESRVVFSLCLILAISGEVANTVKIKPTQKCPDIQYALACELWIDILHLLVKWFYFL